MREAFTISRRSYGLQGIVHFTGWSYKPEDMPHVYPALDMLVLASTSPEPFGLVLLEAMATAKPVIATNQVDLPKFVLKVKRLCLFRRETKKSLPKQCSCFFEIRKRVGEWVLRVESELRNSTITIFVCRRSKRYIRNYFLNLDKIRAELIWNYPLSS